MSNSPPNQTSEWILEAAKIWKDQGGQALQSRGEFLVALDGSPAVLETCRTLAQQDWPWSSTRFIPVMENWAAPDSRRNIASAIYKALYPHRIEMTRWRTQHSEPERAAREFGRQLQQSGGRPKFDLCLLSASGADSLADCAGEAVGFELASIYTSHSTKAKILAMTAWALEPTRSTVLLDSSNSKVSSECLLHSVIQSADEKDALHRILKT